MSNKKKIYSEGRIQGKFTPVRHEVLDLLAWKHTSPGARLLYIALTRRLSFIAYNNGRVYLSTRKASEELGAHRNAIRIWYSELEHYGFVVMTEPGSLGPAGRAAHWRITDMSWGELDGRRIAATKDYLKWDGVLFKERRQKNRNVCTPNVPARHTKCATAGTPNVPGGEETGTPNVPYAGPDISTPNMPYLDTPSPVPGRAGPRGAAGKCPREPSIRANSRPSRSRHSGPCLSA